MPHFGAQRNAPLFHYEMTNIVMVFCVGTTLIVFFTKSDPAETNLLFRKGICSVKNDCFVMETRLVR